jgi:putative transcriptional regulator
MSSRPEDRCCEYQDLVAAFALSCLAADERTSMQAHLAACVPCREQYEALIPVTGELAAWRDHGLPRMTPLWDRLLERIAGRAQRQPAASPAASPRAWSEPHWQQAAPGITCKLLSTDVETDRVSMLVRLSPGTAYPPHQHASVEELYLLEGELWIDENKLNPGDYNRAEPGTADHRVWSPTGCMCLLITSRSDQLR